MSHKFSSILKGIPNNCSSFEDPLYLLAFIYADISNEDYFIKFNQCQDSKKKKAKWILRYENASFYLSHKEYKTIKRIHEKIKKDVWGDQVPLDYINQSLLRKINPKYTFDQIIRKLDKDSAINILKKAYLYLRTKNIGAFEAQIEKLLYRPSYLKMTTYFSDKEVREYKEVIKSINEHSPQNRLFNIYLIKEHIQVDEKDKDFFEKYIEISMTDYLANLNSPQYALSYPDVWAKWAYNNLKPSDFYKQFNKVKFEMLPRKQLISFEFYRGTSLKKLKRIIPILQKLKVSSENEEQSLFYQVTVNQRLQNDLNKINKNLIPSISQRRQFYRESLLGMNSINDNVYKLFMH